MTKPNLDPAKDDAHAATEAKIKAYCKTLSRYHNTIIAFDEKSGEAFEVPDARCEGHKTLDEAHLCHAAIFEETAFKAMEKMRKKAQDILEEASRQLGLPIPKDVRIAEMFCAVVKETNEVIEVTHGK